jgi:hypothetical protein
MMPALSPIASGARARRAGCCITSSACERAASRASSLLPHRLRTFREFSSATIYARAAASLGIETRTLDPDAAVHALFRLGGMLHG